MIILGGLLLLLAAGQNDKSTLDSLRKISQKSPQYALARYQMADRYLADQSVVGRRKAMGAIEDALRSERSNLQFHAMKIRILFEQGFYRQCDQAAGHLLSIRPTPGQSYNEPYAEAYYYRGRVAERSALKYKNMISIVESNQLDLSAYGIKDMLRAAQFYEQALVYNASHRDAIFHLAMLYFEIKSYDRMAYFFERLTNRDSSDAEVHCFAALANYHAGRFDRCDFFYDRALSLMDPATKLLYQDIRPVSPKADHQPSENADVRNTYWRKRDPILLTDYNERLLEHYNRLTYANLRFGVPKLKKTGWQTDRGVIFIRYGEPVFRYKLQPDEHLLGGRETWVYPDYTFHFDDEYASGHFVMDQPSYLAYRSAVNTRQESYTMPPAQAFDLAADAFQFKGRNGRTKIRAYLSALANQVDPSFDETGYPVRIHQGLFVLDAGLQSIAELRSLKDFTVEQMNDFAFADQLEIEVDPDQTRQATLAMEWLVEGDQRFGAVRQPVAMRIFSNAELCLSDLVVGVQDDWSPFRSSRRLTTADHVRLYFEFYNLTLDDDHMASYTVTTSLIRQPRTGISSLWSGDRSDPVLKSVFDGKCQSRDEVYSLGLNVRDVDPGTYTLKIEVTDQLANRSAVATTVIHLLPPESGSN